jgi:hypothetical protein
MRCSKGHTAQWLAATCRAPAFQPRWERANKTDYTLPLHCLVGLFEDQTGRVGHHRSGELARR